MLEYMTESDHSALIKVDSFEELAEIGVSILSRIKADGHEIGEICGPLSTGGLGSPDLNRERFQRAIDAVRERGYIIFDQLPFEDAIRRIMKRYDPSEYCHDILDVFYATIFETGHITKFFFIPGWESSTGARWERKRALQHGIEIIDIPLDWF